MLAFIPFHEALMQSQNRTIPMVLRCEGSRIKKSKTLGLQKFIQLGRMLITIQQHRLDSPFLKESATAL